MESKQDRINQNELISELIKELMDAQQLLYGEYVRIYEDNDNLSYSAKAAFFRNDYETTMYALKVCTERLVVAMHDNSKLS